MKVKRTASERASLRHYYQHFRQHQRNCAVDGGGSRTIYPSGRIELSYGGASYGMHALAAFESARGHISFMRRLEDDAHKIKAARRRRRAKRAS